MTSSLQVPYVQLGTQSAPQKRELLAAVEKVIDSGNYILGNEVSAFEKEFSEYCSAETALGVANGTCSLHLIMRSLGIGAGDEVITAPNSFLASAATIDLVGAKPVFADIGSDLNIDPEKIEEAITKKTKALMPVHLTGRPAQMNKILAIAKRHNLYVIEDAAQSVGAKYDDQRVGSIGDFGSFSLHPLKNLYAFGDAGMITVKSKGLVEDLKMRRNHGLKNRNECDFWSFNCRLDEIQAAMLRINLRKLDEWTQARRNLALTYNEQLAAVVTVPVEGPREHCVYQTYMIKAERRDKLMDYLISRGIDVKVHYPIPLHMQRAASDLGYSENDFPMAVKASKEILSLPLYPGLSSAQQEHVISSIRSFYEG